MIKLKNGTEVAYNKDIDLFFHNLVQSIVHESLKAVKFTGKESGLTEAEEESREDLVLKEIMDNCIFITHQIYEMAKTDEKLAKFLTTGFLFNYVMQLYNRFEKSYTEAGGDGGGERVH